MNLESEDVYNAFYSSVTVFTIQCILLSFIFNQIFYSSTFKIQMPSSPYTLGARFVCTILMHWQVEGDVRQGLKMMKFTANHWKEFANPFFAFLNGFMQFNGGFLCEIACLLYLSSIDNTIDVIIRFIALGSIAKVDDFYASALPSENKIKNEACKIRVRNRRRNIEKGERPLLFRFLRFVYKFNRMMYVSYIFYFLPFTTLFVPYMYTSR